MVRGAWGCMVGRTVVAVTCAEMTDDRDSVHLCFSDGTCFEVYGHGFSGSSRLRFGSVRQVVESLTRQGRPHQVHTEVAPALDPRDVEGPAYIGFPDWDVVKRVDGEGARSPSG
jgi:hypothetical protein